MNLLINRINEKKKKKKCTERYGTSKCSTCVVRSTLDEGVLFL